MLLKFLVSAVRASVRSCSRCGGGLSGIGVVMLAMLTSACTAVGMSRLQSSQRTAVAICAAAQALEAGSDRKVAAQASQWCASAIRLAAAETQAAAAQIEAGIAASEDAGIEVPQAARDAGVVAGVPESDDNGAAGLEAPSGADGGK